MSYRVRNHKRGKNKRNRTRRRRARSNQTGSSYQEDSGEFTVVIDRRKKTKLGVISLFSDEKGTVSMTIVEAKDLALSRENLYMRIIDVSEDGYFHTELGFPVGSSSLAEVKSRDNNFYDTHLFLVKSIRTEARESANGSDYSDSQTLGQNPIYEGNSTGINNVAGFWGLKTCKDFPLNVKIIQKAPEPDQEEVQQLMLRDPDITKEMAQNILTPPKTMTPEEIEQVLSGNARQRPKIGSQSLETETSIEVQDREQALERERKQALERERKQALERERKQALEREMEPEPMTLETSIEVQEQEQTKTPSPTSPRS